MQTEARTPNPHSILICALLPLKQGTESNFRQQIGTQLWEHQISATAHLNPAGLEMTSKCAHEFFISKFTVARRTGLVQVELNGPSRNYKNA